MNIKHQIYSTWWQTWYIMHDNIVGQVDINIWRRIVGQQIKDKVFISVWNQIESQIGNQLKEHVDKY